MKLAAHIVDTKAGHFEPKTFEDHYEKALVELLKSKQAGRSDRDRRRGRGGAARDQSHGCAAASIDARPRRPAAASTGRGRPAAKRKAGTLTEAMPNCCTSLGKALVAFTGRLASMKRDEAFALVRQQGGTPRRGLTKTTARPRRRRARLAAAAGRPAVEEPEPRKVLRRRDRQRAAVPRMGRQGASRASRRGPTPPTSSRRSSGLPLEVIGAARRSSACSTAATDRYGFRDLAAARQLAELLAIRRRAFDHHQEPARDPQVAARCGALQPAALSGRRRTPFWSSI